MVLKIADNTDENYAFGMVAGRAGVGKTTQLTTFPISETLGVSVEDGFLSIQGSGYYYEEISTYDEILSLLTNLPTQYPWVKYLYIDSLTEIYDTLKSKLKGEFKPSQNFAKHEEMYDKFLYIIRLARQLKVHVFFTCHTKEDKDGLALIQNLAFDGKMPEMVKKQFDLCLHLEDVDVAGQKKRMFITDPSISKLAKTRLSPWLNVKLEQYEEPNLYKLVQKVLGKQGE